LDYYLESRPPNNLTPRIKPVAIPTNVITGKTITNGNSLSDPITIPRMAPIVKPAAERRSVKERVCGDFNTFKVADQIEP
jgi:hypothetical protein